MNTRLLKSHIVKNDSSQRNLAKAMGLSSNALSAKITENGSVFRKSEMLFIKDRYKLTDEEFCEIFFN